jgi:nucleoid-associated protein YgaU
MTDVFSPVEQQQLAKAPQLIRHLLTIADKGGMLLTKRSETKALGEYMKKYHSQSPIVQAIIAGQPEKEEKIGATSEEALKALEQVGALIEDRTDPAQGDAVRDFLMGAGKAVAEASREQGLVAGGGASPAEEKALAAIATALKATDYDKSQRIAVLAAKAQKQAEEAQARAKAAAEAADQQAAEDAKAKVAAAAAAQKQAVEEAKAKAEAATNAMAEARARAEAEAKAKAEQAHQQAEAQARQIAEQMARQREEAAKKAEEQAAQAAALAQQPGMMQPAAEAAVPPATQAAVPPAAQAAAAPAQIIHVVKRGDTLSGIAKALLGDAGRWPEIVELNKNLIKNPNMIKTGWKLRIPPK